MCDSKDCRTAVKRVKLSNFPCEDWPLMGLRYQHTDPLSPDVDYITIRLDLQDTRSGSIYKVMALSDLPHHHYMVIVSGCDRCVITDQHVTNNTL